MPGSRPPHGAVMRHLDAGRFAAFDDHPRYQRVGQHGEIWPVHIGIGVAAEDRLALAVADPSVGQGGAACRLHHDPVLVGEGGHADGAGRFKEGYGAGIGLSRNLDCDQAAGAAPFGIRRSLPILDPALDLEHALIRPRVIAGLGGEMVPVALVTARPDQIITLMLDPPPSTLPMDQSSDRPFRFGFGRVLNAQSRSLPRFSVQRAGSSTSGTASVPPASSSSTLTVGFSARRRATAKPDEPGPTDDEIVGLAEISPQLSLVGFN